MTVSILTGDCRAVLKTLPADSVHSCVTDPPYHLTSIVKRFGAVDAAPAKSKETGVYARSSAGFMGQTWDGGDIAFRPETWAEVLRVLKPGAHLLAFGGTRTYHRLACAIEDAGFEVRDQIQWIFGSGFPKSHDVSKGIDKAAGAERQRYDRPAFGGTFSDDDGTTYGTAISNDSITDAARLWEGWGTALKPAHEPIVLARKPLIGTVVANVLAHGTGALNIDGCRVDGPVEPDRLMAIGTGKGRGTANGIALGKAIGGVKAPPHNLGRWPANVIHDGSDEVLAGFPESIARPVAQEKIGKSGDGKSRGLFGLGSKVQSGYFDQETSAARFFYCAKASKADRDEGIASVAGIAGIGALRDGGRASLPRKNNHPTVKPTDLMRYLCKMVTPPGGTVLDPFMGSGSTGKAARLEQFSFLGIECDPDYVAIAKSRIDVGAPLFAEAMA